MGSLQAAPSGRELGYAQATSNDSTTGTTAPPSAHDVPGLSVSVTVGSRPVKVTVGAALVSHSAASGQSGVAILEDGVEVKRWYSQPGGAGGSGIPCEFSVRRAPSAGPHTYKVQLWAGNAGTVTFFAAATYPSSIRVEET